MAVSFKSLPLGASFTLSGIRYRKTAEVEAESIFAVVIMSGDDTVTV